MVLVNGERMHAISDGMIIEAGQSVEVIEVRGTRVVVRPGVQPTASPESEKPSEPSSRLDFEIPQG
jgi:membrane-bound serine protease (ClpP class)